MPKARQLSDFLAKELLYDYLSGSLDEKRREAVERAINESEEVAQDLKALREGLKYCENLRNTKLSEPLFQFLSRPPKTFRDHAKSWKKLSPSLRYGTEAAVALMLFLVIGFATPKEYRFWEETDTIKAVEYRKAPPVEATEKAAIEVASEVPSEVAKPPSEKTSVKPSEKLVEKSLEKAADKPAEKAAEKTSEKAADKALAAATLPSPAVAPMSAKVAAPTTTLAMAPRGEIIRATMSKGDVEAWTPGVTEEIVRLGGLKAGEVQLGWRRKGGSYFHFSLPQSNYDTLISYLQTLGPVRIVKEPHPRVMPEGTLRLILWIEQGSGTQTTTDGE